MADRKKDAPPVKLSSVVNAARYVPSTSQSSLIVGVRVRPLLKTEQVKAQRKDILRVMDSRVVVVLDPDDVVGNAKDYLDQVQNRTKEKRYTFDVAFGADASNEDVYNGTVRDLVSGVLYGINTTVFAYGATGSGKTYTMVGSPGDPGLMVLSLQRIFQDRDRHFADEQFEVTCTYLEVYNELIYDLLVKNSGPLELREDPEQGVQVAGLKAISVNSADEILSLLEEGNKRRKTESTDANAQSSRSHAVLEIAIKRSPKNHYRVQQLRAKLALVDLAGSERAAETNNAGQKLRDGANINRSLLALANCINALGKMAAPGAKGGASYVPYRNSKLTRLLKDGLSGNSRTAMIATVAAASDQYHHSINTLKYADRAKEIKTHVVQNVGTVESHIADYQRIIDNLQLEVQDLKQALSDRQSHPAPPVHSVGGAGPSSGGGPRVVEDELLTCIDTMVQEMHENIEERINLQKALFEIEDANLFNRYELKQLEEYLEANQGNAKDMAEARDRKSDIQAAIKDNDKELLRFKAEISANEESRKDLQARIDRLVSGNQNVAFLNLMSTFRLQAVRVQELKFQMAVRDQIISEQREVIHNLWRIIDKSGMGRQKVLDIARQEGIIMDGFLAPLDEIRPNTASTEGLPIMGQMNSDGLFQAAQEAVQVATPNASLVGNRAKMRYRFWAQYNGQLATEDVVGEDREPGMERERDSNPSNRGGPRPSSARKHHTHSHNNKDNSKDNHSPGARKHDKDLPAANKRKGAGIRVEHIAHLHPAPHGRRHGRQAPSYSGGAAGAAGAAGPSGAGQAALSRAVAAAVDGKSGGGGLQGLVKQQTGVGGAMVPSGRRAGLPRPSMGLDLGGVSVVSDGPMSHRDHTNTHNQPNDSDPLEPAIASRAAWADPARPPVPPQPAPLGERLARIKAGRLGAAAANENKRRTESDGAIDGLQGVGEPAPVDGQAIQATLAVAGVGLLNARPPSRTKTNAAASAGGGVPLPTPDALDQHIQQQQQRRVSSAGSGT